MGANPYETALDFLPSEKVPAVMQVVAKLKSLAAALSEGQAAHHEYKSLIAHGIDPTTAARKVFEDNFAK